MSKPIVTNAGVSNPRKIQSAIFIENIQEVVEKFTAEKVMEALQEAYSKYKMMETTLTRSRDNMKTKVPEIKKAIEIVSVLDKKQEEEMVIDFLLTDAIWSKAKIPANNQKVHLWLGASIMVEYSFEEAKTLLNKNLENAQQNLTVFEEDLSFLKDQITTMEVNIARVYNFNVKQMQEQKAKQLQAQMAQQAKAAQQQQQLSPEQLQELQKLQQQQGGQSQGGEGGDLASQVLGKPQ